MLKNIFVVVLLAYSSIIFSQRFEPTKERVEYDDEMAESWKVKIPCSLSDTRKSVKRFFKDKFGVKIKGGGFLGTKDVFKAEEAMIRKVAPKKINLYVSIIDEDGLSELKIFANYDSTLYFDDSNHKEEFTALRSIIVDYLNYYLPLNSQERIDESEKKMEDFTKDKSNVSKKIRNNKKEIESLKVKNEKLENDLVTLEDNIKQSKIEVKKKKKEYRKLKDELGKIKR